MKHGVSSSFGEVNIDVELDLGFTYAFRDLEDEVSNYVTTADFGMAMACFEIVEETNVHVYP